MLLKSKHPKISHEEHLPITLYLELPREAVEAELTQCGLEQLPPDQTPLFIVFAAGAKDHKELVETADYQLQ